MNYLFVSNVLNPLPTFYVSQPHPTLVIKRLFLFCNLYCQVRYVPRETCSISPGKQATQKYQKEKSR